MNKRQSAGFTLIEIIIVIAIIGVIAAIALPSFFDNVLTVNRKAAIAEMNDIAQQLERAYTNNNGAYPNDHAITTQPKGYTIAIAVPANLQSYTITATADSNQSADSCGNLSIDSSGLRTTSKSTVATCFR